MFKRGINKTAIFLFITYILSLYIVGTTLAKFTSSVETRGGVQVAVMANDITFDVNMLLSGSPGESILYPVKITNSENGAVCEVPQSFTLSLITNQTGNIPLLYELFLDETGNIPLTLNSNGVYESDNFNLKAKEKDEVTIYLKVNGPKEENDPSLAFELDYVTFSISINQI